MRLRDRACDRAEWPHRRHLSFVYTDVSGFDTLGVMRAIYAALAPTSELPAAPEVGGETYNWGTDEAYQSFEGDGILVAEHCFGAMPGDGVDIVYHLLVRDDVAVIVDDGTDYTQNNLVFEIGATAEMLDVATDVILQIVTAAGLAFAAREDAPRHDHRRHYPSHA